MRVEILLPDSRSAHQEGCAWNEQQVQNDHAYEMFIIAVRFAYLPLTYDC